MKRTSIVTIGAAVKDVFLVSDQFHALKSSKSITGVMECVALGTKVDAQTLVFSSGGGATNAAATFQSLGFNTSIITNIGNDENGKEILNELKKRGIKTTYINQIRGGQTGYSTLLTMPEGERTAVVYRGVSNIFHESHIHWSAIKKADWIYLTSLGNNPKLAKKIITFAHKHHVHVAWNPGSQELSQGWKFLSPLLSQIDVLIMNKEESILATNETNAQKRERMLKTTNHFCIITDGSNGTKIFHEKKTIFIGTSKIKGISKTGAGDAFGSGFLAAFLKTKNPIRAGQIGTINAESVIQHLGAKKGILTSWPTEAQQKKIPTK